MEKWHLCENLNRRKNGEIRVAVQQLVIVVPRHVKEGVKGSRRFE